MEELSSAHGLPWGTQLCSLLAQDKSPAVMPHLPVATMLLHRAMLHIWFAPDFAVRLEATLQLSVFLTL